MRLTRRAVPLALTVALAVAGVVYLGAARRPPTFEVVQLWTWTAAPAGDAAPYVAALRSPELRAAVAAELQAATASGGERGAVGDWLDGRRDPAGVRIVVRAPSEQAATERSAAVARTFAAWSADLALARREADLAAAQTRVEDVTERVRAAQVLGTEGQDDVAALLEERDAAVEVRDAALALLANGAPVPLVAGPDVVRTRPANAARDALLSGAAAGVLALLAGVRGAAPERAPTQRPGPKPRPKPRPAPRSGRRPERERARAPEPVPAPDALATFPAATGDDVPALRTPAEALARAVAKHRGSSSAPTVLLIVSVEAGAGKTTVASLLAEALTRAGRRALLVDASLWSPALAARYALVEAPNGAASRVASTLDWMQRPLGNHHVVGVDLGSERRLDLVPQFRATRPAPGTAPALFGAFGDALGRWRGYDVVVVDTAALDAVDDTRYLAPFATAAIVVVGRRNDGRRHRDDARRRLREADVSLLGFVVNEPRAPEDAGADSATDR